MTRDDERGRYRPPQTIEERLRAIREAIGRPLQEDDGAPGHDGPPPPDRPPGWLGRRRHWLGGDRG